jgi:hypothetical protein
MKLFGFYKNREISLDASTTSIVITGVENSPRWGPCIGSSTDCETFKSIITAASDNYDITVLKNEKATVSAWKQAVKKAVEKPLKLIFLLNISIKINADIFCLNTKNTNDQNKFINS